jgi:hypothetical protein
LSPIKQMSPKLKNRYLYRIGLDGDDLHLLSPEPADHLRDGRQQADQLNGELLIMFSDMDENVPPSSILRFIDGLVVAGKDFDMLYLPGRNHPFAEEGHVVRRQWDYFVRNVLNLEPPEIRITRTGR